MGPESGQTMKLVRMIFVYPLPLGRTDSSLAAPSTVTVTDVASGHPAGAVHGTISVQLRPAQSKLLELPGQ